MPLNIEAIDTPAFLVNEEIALRNIARFQEHCNSQGLNLRPHIKTHKSIRFAKAQIAAGAVGITCQKISEAEAMLAEGIDDVLITYNIVGNDKLSRLRALSERVEKLSVVADNVSVIDGLSVAFDDADKELSVLVECDTGALRCGVQSPSEAVDLARLIINRNGLTFGGLMTYPAKQGGSAAEKFLAETIVRLEAEGIACPTVSSGGSPEMWSASGMGVVTEYRIGTYIYNDRSLIQFGACEIADCAGHIVATVVSTPTPDRAVIDAGSKALTSDLIGFADYGFVVGHPEIRITSLSEEHGVMKVAPKNSLQVGDKVRIIPNHVCVVSNLFDSIWLELSDGSLHSMPVDARGRVW